MPLYFRGCMSALPELSSAPQSHNFSSDYKTMANTSQTALFRRQIHGNRITENKNNLTERLLHLAVQLLCLQTEENYVMLKKYGSKHCSHPQHSDTSFTIEFSLLSLIPENNRILEATKNIIELLAREVPIRCQDVTVYFSMEEWEYLEEHVDLYNNVILENKQLFGSMGYFNSKRSFEKICETGESGNQRAETLLKSTKELIDLLTGESYILVKTSKIVTDKDPIIESLPHLKLPERNNNKNNKILDTTKNILKLLTEEVPIRCQDIAVHFSMDEWEYLQEHKDIYKDVIMENPQPLISLEVSAIVNARPLVPVSSDPDYPVILTPASLLTQKIGTVTASSGEIDPKDIYRHQWKQIGVYLPISLMDIPVALAM